MSQLLVKLSVPPLLTSYVEANSISTAFTPHPCKTIEQHSCEGDACGGTYSSTRYAGDCDPDGCDFNSYRQGVLDFYGKGMTVDTSSKFTVVTQFIKGSSGGLETIKRYYVQNGKLIPNSESTISGTSGNQIDTAYCTAQKTAFGDTDDFSAQGGLAQMGKALDKGMVLVMSLWDDVSFHSICCSGWLGRKSLVANMKNKISSITPTCSGWTAATLSTRPPRSLALPAAPAIPRLAFPLMLRASRPATRLFTATFASDPSTRPLLLPKARWTRQTYGVVSLLAWLSVCLSVYSPGWPHTSNFINSSPSTYI